ncbi:MAG: PTS sugar transporter subunit IIA [Clostridium sp.]|jgi:PTS system galactitol-specific IIA component|uniref:PTS sugar transporter subunit IIA n=1 Tax=Clostridium sp. TaxID=1506 RepID=UPI0025B80B29|nr:PTS sugar transporter subunit IIA [Clostridium sp.]MCH3965106.1 PTS sugar transporter subunit IIA [Clostridium sp.]MCI1714327.1 PTS sugar transporter subunit IIA [Clostridium sp.]MCI1798589.1 PTS sugar transporter subunit IIA [Clostridium sp.]MCI1812680.1 PTS sugar transporter subunit IIA [Clostridium sp.]MCI1869398.1 PTS sugar transporter subunit IIA [Clostridium sp.]
MQEESVLLHEDLVLIDYEAENQEQLLINLSEILRQKGYVKNSYVKGILERENTFPTGLNTDGIKVAIPHTDAKHVNVPGILIAKLKNPIVFREMGSDTGRVEASLIFMMAIKNPEQQVKTLSNLMNIFSKQSILKDIYASESPLEVIEKLKFIMD